MAVSIKELIEKKESIEAKKKELYDLETSIGTITVKQPTRSYIADVSDMDDSDALVVLDCVVEPDLKDKGLQEAYACVSPLDIVGKLFKGGEVVAISKAILKSAGYGEDIRSELHNEAKN